MFTRDVIVLPLIPAPVGRSDVLVVTACDEPMTCEISNRGAPLEANSVRPVDCRTGLEVADQRGDTAAVGECRGEGNVTMCRFGQAVGVPDRSSTASREPPNVGTAGNGGEAVRRIYFAHAVADQATDICTTGVNLAAGGRADDAPGGPDYPAEPADAVTAAHLAVYVRVCHEAMLDTHQRAGGRVGDDLSLGKCDVAHLTPLLSVREEPDIPLVRTVDVQIADGVAASVEGAGESADRLETLTGVPRGGSAGIYGRAKRIVPLRLIID